MAAHDSRTPPLTYQQLVSLFKEVDAKYRQQKRRAAVWECPYAPADKVTIVDTAVFNPATQVDFQIHDAYDFPPNVLLVVLHPSYIQKLKRAWVHHHSIPSDREIAGVLIDVACSKDPTLNAKLGWR